MSDDKIKWDQVNKWVARSGLKTTWKPYGMPEVLDPFTSRFADIDPMPKWDIPDKVMIAATITGAFFSKSNVDHFLQLKQIAHLLGRDVMSPAQYRQALGMPAKTVAKATVHG